MAVHYASASLQARMNGESLLEMARSLRMDNLKCEAGNKACGKRCIPQEQTCKATGGVAKKIVGTAIGIGAVAGLMALNGRNRGGQKKLGGSATSPKALTGSKALPQARGTTNVVDDDQIPKKRMKRANTDSLAARLDVFLKK